MTEAQWSKLRMEINVIMVLQCLPGRMQCSWLHVKQFTVCGLITKCLGLLYSRKIQFQDNTPLRIMRTLSSLNNYWVQCGLFPLCMSSIQSDTQLRISCSHAKDWISLCLCRSPPCQLQHLSWSVMPTRIPRVSWLLVLRGNIWKGWGERLLKCENQSSLLTVGLYRQEREREKYPIVPSRHQAWSTNKHDPILYTGWHGMSCCKTEPV